MLFFGKNKLDPIVKLKLKEKTDRHIPVIIKLKEPISNRIKNSITKNGGKIKYEYKCISMASAFVSLEDADRLSELPEVENISYDRKANICMDKVSEGIGINFNNPYNLTGRNVTTAIIDTGVYLHGDLSRPYRVISLFKDYVNSIREPYDDNGHGTFMCGAIAGSGSMCEGKYKGIANGSKIIMLKAFNSVGEGAFSDIIASIDWVIENKTKNNIRVLCLPFGADVIQPYKSDPLCIACEAAISSEIIVVAASGNKGPNQGTITTPGIDPFVITVGSCEYKDSTMRSFKISDFSGRGSKKDNETKPDFITPGTGIVSLSSDKGYIPGKSRKISNLSLDNPYCIMSGSSISTAIACGCIALYLEKMPAISSKDLKGVLKLSCQTLNEVKTAQGGGILNLKKLMNE